MQGAPRMQRAPQVFPRAGVRRLYTWAAIGAAAIVFAGFSRTYFLKPVFGTPPLPGIVHVHGVIMTLWIAVLVVQARLIAIRRVDLHRRVGVAGAVLALVVVVMGVAVAINAARRGSSPGPPPLVFLAVPMADMVVFASLAGLGLYFRRKPEIHRRLMLLSTLGILPAAFARIGMIVRSGNPLPFASYLRICASCSVSRTTPDCIGASMRHFSGAHCW
ncbi:MAG TPA: hypothetical protein VN428_09870 [Bryobacteraceae bacterium]|nr:hypothetical protein [Bryobacteraceae bacterium]